MSTARFYDELADTYHALYPDWRSECRSQGEVLHQMLVSEQAGPLDVADVACGIGTQVIGLAGLGHRVFGVDISAGAIRRARRECVAARVAVGLAVADMRSVPLAASSVDAVVCADNALPHLLSDGDVVAALAEMTRVLRPGGVALVTTRDYDQVLADRSAGTRPQVSGPAGGRVISYQLWAWREGTRIYDLEHFQIQEQADGSWGVQRRTATYRAYTRHRLTELTLRAGLQQVLWHMPPETGFFQQVMTACKPL